MSDQKQPRIHPGWGQPLQAKSDAVTTVRSEPAERRHQRPTISHEAYWKHLDGEGRSARFRVVCDPPHCLEPFGVFYYYDETDTIEKSARYSRYLMSASSDVPRYKREEAERAQRNALEYQELAKQGTTNPQRGWRLEAPIRRGKAPGYFRGHALTGYYIEHKEERRSSHAKRDRDLTDELRRHYGFDDKYKIDGQTVVPPCPIMCPRCERWADVTLPEWVRAHMEAENPEATEGTVER